MSEETWRSLHVAYHDDDRDELICDGVAPLYVSGGARGYFVRHWRRGPHLRLNFRTDDDTYARTIRPAASRLAAASMARRPSALPLDRTLMLEAHKRRAEIDGDEGPLTPWYEDNTIHDAPYEAPTTGFSGRGATGLLEDFYCSTGDLVFDSLRRVRRGHSRLGLLFDIWIATAHALGQGSHYSWISYRSHAEKFLHSSGDTGRFISVWKRRYARQRDTLTAQAETLLHALDAGGTGPAAARDWVTAMRPFQSRARKMIESGDLTFPAPDSATGLPGLRAELSSPFHQVMLANDGMFAHTTTVDFLTYRVMLTLTYAHGARLGISLVERYFLCHLVAATMEDITGVDGAELVASAEFFEESART